MVKKLLNRKGTICYCIHQKISAFLVVSPRGPFWDQNCPNLYINDIFDVSQLLKLILFADDTNIFYSSNNYNELVNTVNEELNKLKKWMDNNKLSLNRNKTKAMMFGTYNQFGTIDND